MSSSLLSSSEVAALRELSSDAAVARSREGARATAVDLIVREHCATAMLPRFERAVRGWAETAGYQIAQELRRRATLELDSIEVVPASRARDMAGDVPFRYRLGHNVGFVGIGSWLGRSFVEQQFGGDADDAALEGPVSATERRTVARLARALYRTLVEAAAPVAEIPATLHVEEPVTNLRDAGAVVLLSLVCRVDDNEDLLVVSLSTAHLRVRPAASSNGARPAARSPLREHLGRVKLEASVELGGATLTVRELMALKPGDVMLLDSAVEADVPLFIQRRAKFRGRPMQSRGSLALRIEGLIEE